MEKGFARKLVKDALQHSFEKERFTYLVRNLLNNIEETPETTYRGSYIRDAFRDHIKTLDRIGKYQDSDGKKLDILVVHLKKTTGIEYARTMQRNFIAWYLNGSRGGVEKDAALVAFVAPGEEDWRFSFVKMEYKFVETPKGHKAQQDFTPARRYSFLVGENENSHTAQRQLVPFLLDDDHHPKLTQLEEAFSIEKVTEEFFEKYRDLFIRLKKAIDEVVTKDSIIKEDFKQKNVNTVDFTKKLLGQIVFLYFLQKKGWFGVARDAEWATGPKDFLRRLFEKEHGDYNNFFNDILEPLFYEALALKRTGDFYSRFNCKIPFLNGGLFDPINNYDWVHTDILLPNELFSNDIVTKEGDIGSGILDVFDRYNFTVKEDEPLEKEVAIDPEMLGKIFEKLGAINDSNFEEYLKAIKSHKKSEENKFNKKFGVYYTPREVVHYMCQQSLINYLDTTVNSAPKPIVPEKVTQGKFFGPKEAQQKSLATDSYETIVPRQDLEFFIQHGESALEHDKRVEAKGRETKTYPYRIPETIRNNANVIDKALESIRICDPAIGSGAFPVGIMTEITRTRNVLTNYLTDKTKRTIYNFKWHAVENSLYGVDVDNGAVEIAKLRLWLSLIVEEQDIKQIHPLPNLTYRILKGDSLLDSLFGYIIQLDMMAKIPEVRKLVGSIETNKHAYFQEWRSDEKNKLELQILSKQVDLVKYLIEAKSAAINYTDNMFGEEAMTTKQRKDKANSEKKLDELFELKTKVATAKTELEQLINQKDTLNDEELRLLIRQHQLNHPTFIWYLDFADIFNHDGGFDVVIANPPYIFSRENLTKEDKANYKRNYTLTQFKINLYILFIEKSFNLMNRTGCLAFITPNNWLTLSTTSDLRRFILTKTKDINIVLNYEKVFENASVDTCILTFKKMGKSVIKTYEWSESNIELVNSQNPKFYLKNTNFTISNVHSGSDVNSALCEKICSISELLSNFAEVRNGVQAYTVGEGTPVQTEDMKERRVYHSNVQKDQTWIKYFDGVDVGRYVIGWSGQFIKYGKNLSRSRKPELFKDERLLVRQIPSSPPYCINSCYVTEHAINDNNSMIIKVYDDQLSLKYILALINSMLVSFWFVYTFGKLQRKIFPQFKVKELRIFPIRKISKEMQKPYIGLVDKILNITKKNDFLENPAKQAKIKELEKQIDQMVYKLYDLTKEEIAIIEGLDKNDTQG